MSQWTDKIRKWAAIGAVTFFASVVSSASLGSSEAVLPSAHGATVRPLEAGQKENIVIDVVTGATAVVLPDRPIRIASIVLPEMPSTLEAVDSTVELLRQAFKPHPIEYEVLSSPQLSQKIMDGEVDAFIASAGYFLRMAKYGSTAVGTLISKRQPDPNNATALTILVRSGDDRFEELSDLKDTTLGANFETAFMTYRIGLAEIAKLGEDPEKFFKDVVFTHFLDNGEAVDLLDREDVDAVMVKACWLEEQPPEVQARYRVINRKFGDILCQHSTDAYPGIMLAVTQGAPPNIAHIIARTILNQPDVGDGHRWGVATDLSSVDQVYRLLKIENYAYLREMTVAQWLNKYWQLWTAGLILLFGLMLQAWRTSVLVKKRTAELTETLAVKDRALKENQKLSEQMEGLHKVTVVGQLSSMIAHELAQPLSVIEYSCESQRDILKSGHPNPALLEKSLAGIEKGLQRTRDIVNKVRAYNRGSASRTDAVEVCPAIQRVKASLNPDLLKKSELTVTCEKDLRVRADRLEFELILTNLIKNALESSCEDVYPLVTVECFRSGETVVTRVENSGKVLTEEDFQRIRTPLLTSKATGLGLGVTIASALAEASGGQIRFSPREGGGLIAEVTLNAADTDTTDESTTKRKTLDG